MSFELLLKHADDRTPVLRRGLPTESASTEPRPESPERASRYLWDHGGDPNDLPAQRWGVIVPQGEAGKRLREWISRLVELRQEQSGAPVQFHEVPPGQDVSAALQWKRRVLMAEPEHKRARYLLLLGDFDAVSLGLQQALAADAFVGRLAFPDARGYEAYVDKVLRWEKAPSPHRKARALFFTVQDGTHAIRTGYAGLMTPSLAACRERKEEGDFPAEDLQELDTPGDRALYRLLTGARVPHPSVLLSLSHGLGPPVHGWKSEQEQRALQGAMDLGKGDSLQAPDVERRPFLPGSIWLYLACFGAGTPATSTYRPWLARLREAGVFPGDPDRVLAALSGPARPPFMAALPQAALSNPDGPLAIVGHVDLAWTGGFMDPEGRISPSRFVVPLREFVKGRRVGVGMNALLRDIQQLNTELTLLDEQAEHAGGVSKLPSDQQTRRATLWMIRQDLSAYVLLGDPAVRLPLSAPR